MTESIGRVPKLWFLVMILFLFSAVVVQAQAERINDLVVQRIAPETAFIGQKIWIQIKIENVGSLEREVKVTERLGDCDFNRTGAKYVETDYGEKFWYYEWKVKLPPGKSVTLFYWIIPKSIGNYVASPTQIEVGEDVFRLKSLTVKVKCKTDGRCDVSAGENYLTCPQDCDTGEADNICDFKMDGKCDPDCKEEGDPDCKEVEKPSGIPIQLATGIIIGIGVLLFVLIRFKKKIHKKKS